MHYRPISSMGRIQTHQSIYRIKIPVALSQCGTHPDEHISRDLMTNIIYSYDLELFNDTQSQKVFNVFQYAMQNTNWSKLIAIYEIHFGILEGGAIQKEI
eukprot:803093_1